ncbi:tRNA guanosine(34) transglycosylase Tgt [Alphaproteobacteria bacterium endosymbiont of Tiliacea citrago]|uniref:tRNA guanosine(34) transglycosylase Tgt n=1 Tax=Alphaproteobacteria bacterium endosymbiont of Tiliacea citrago TaxID=3077944 RepID=UPI00313B10BF
MNPKFTIIKETEFGRLGEIETAHGTIQTPAFIFCGTKAAVKACSPDILKRTKTQIILSNTYHLLVYPGSEKIDELGGLQKMTAWNGPMMTDSGGYQIFSLGYGSVSQELKGIRNTKKTLVKIKEEGAKFKSYRDGKEIFLSPEGAMQAQINFGADLIFALDECTAFHIPKHETESSMERSQRWGVRCANYFNQNKKEHQGLYGIIQGGVYEDLRTKSIKYTNELDCFGIGVGGSLGKDIKDMKQVLEMIKAGCRKDRPKHLLGIGTIDAILMAIPYGIDTFDCVYPTRLARHGGALVRAHEKARYLNLNNSKFFNDSNPIDKSCACHTCKNFSRSYLHILLKNDEQLALMALTEHNICFMNNFMEEIRLALLEETWQNFLYKWVI